MKKVLITDNVHDIMCLELAKNGYEVDYDPDISRDEVRRIIHAYQGIVINSRMYMDAEMMDLGSGLEWIARLGSGLEIIDLSAAAQRNIRVINSPEGNCDAVAEHAIGMLLTLSNHILRADGEVRDLQWNREKNRGWEIGDKTFGIIGFGHTGSAVARRLQGWNVEVLAYDKYKSGYAQDMPHVAETTLEKVLQGSEIISLHVPLTGETHKMVSSALLQKCRKGVVIINTSRGAVVDTPALIRGLESGQLGGLCMDVFENEKVETWTSEEEKMYRHLYGFENVVLTPHIAGWTQQSKKKLSEVLLKKIFNVKT